MSMITATAWVPRGFAAQFPTRHQLNEEEYDRISKLSKLQLDDAKEDLKDALEGGEEESDGGVAVSKTNGHATSKPENDDDLKEYNLEHYDEEPEILSDHEEDERDGTGIFGNIKGLAYHENNDEDPYITLNKDADEISDEDEREELEILPTDNMLLAARVEDEVAHLECYVYEDDADNLYVHHDIMLPAIPLCVEWIDLPVGKEDAPLGSRGNFIAVGTMEPDIELWDLDTVDVMYPNAILGAGSQPTSDKPTKKKKKKSRKAHTDYHVDAVLSLSANRQHRNLLASASADETVKLWDLNTAKCAKSYGHHSDKVCSLAWNPVEATAMLTGGYDRLVYAADMRAPEAGFRRWKVDSDVEKVTWDPHNSNNFMVSTESGILHYFDARQTGKGDGPSDAIWRLQAHSSALTTFSVNPYVKGYLATGSDDKTVKLWNFDQSGSAEGKGPSLIVSRELELGRIFSVNFAPDELVGYRLAVAGSTGSLKVWDTSTNSAVRRAFDANFRGRSGAGDSIISANGSTNLKERIVSLDQGGGDNDETDDSDEDDEDDDDEESEDEEMVDSGSG